MQSIGITTIGIGLVSAVFLAFVVVFDIPSGIAADKWSRKSILIISAVSLAVASFIYGSSMNLTRYLLGTLFYGLYVVSTSGTYGAMIYDTLHEVGKSEDYSRINGRAFGLFLAGAGVANVASGFIAHRFSYSTDYYITIVSCLLNIVVMLTLYEPTFHKSLKKERMVREIHAASLTIMRLHLLRGLTVILTLLSVVEMFKLEFGQLYMLRYVSSPQTIGILWALFAFAMALGSFIAHRFKTRLNILVLLTCVPYLLMSFVDNSISLGLFMIQAIAGAALINQIETHVQNSTPSNVRASILSVLSTLGRIVAIPASLLFGWLFLHYGSLTGLRFTAGTLSIVLLYWLWLNSKLSDEKLN